MWVDEYYPVPATSPKARRAPVAHSLRKWNGLQPAALAKHGMLRVGRRILSVDEDEDQTFTINSDSCALCWKYLKTGRPAEDHSRCGDCPLRKVRGGVPCDTTRPREDMSPYHRWVETGNPGRMIYWLRKAREIHP